MSLSFSTGFLEPFYTGAGTVAAAGLASPVSLGGVIYEYDTSERYRGDFQHASVPFLRAAFDERENASLATLNPEAFWRRSFESWHVGAGQTHFDRRDESNSWRFRRSKNINVWDRNQVSLLNATDGKALFDDINVFLAVAGDYLYVSDGNELKRTQDVTPASATLTTITGVPANDISSIASDGFSVLTAHGSNGVYKTTRGAATTVSQITGTVTHVFYGKGRWIAAHDNLLYDVTTEAADSTPPSALPAAHFSHHNTDFDWNCFAEGPTALYAGGFSGDKSLIYRLTMKEDGTGLNQPVVAGFLPDGELITAMYGYLGFVLIGTSKGVRVGVVGGNGDLTIGAFIPTDAAVQCFEGQGTFVWFGWSDFENEDSGLGRINMETFSDTEALAPAYASDLMSGTADGTITSVVTFQDRRVFGLAAGGFGLVVAEEVGKLAVEGEIDSGLFDYGLSDDKLSLYVDMAHIHLGGSHEVWISLDRGDFAQLAEMTEEHQPIATGEARAREFEVRIILNRDSLDNTLGPTIRSWALRAQPAAPVTEQITVPLTISPVLRRADGGVESVDPVAQLDNVVTLCRTKEVTLYTEGERAYSVIVSDYQMDMRNVWIASDLPLGISGTCLVRMKTVN